MMLKTALSFSFMGLAGSGSAFAIYWVLRVIGCPYWAPGGVLS